MSNLKDDDRQKLATKRVADAHGEGWYQRLIIFGLMPGAAMAGAAFPTVSDQRHYLKSHALALPNSIFPAAFIFASAHLSDLNADAALVWLSGNSRTISS